jgi:hypothetical protein
MSDFIKMSALIGLVTVLLVGIPIAVIESMNVLFPSVLIELNFSTWLSTLVLILVFAPKSPL